MLKEQVKSDTMLKPLTQTGLRWLWVSLVIFIIDRYTKYLALNDLSLMSPDAILPFFNLTLVYNQGAAFSFLAHASGWQVWFFGLIAMVISVSIIIWLATLSYQNRWLSVALALIVGGALGNLFDRLIYGYVIDFIDLYVSHFHWPVFNVADMAVCVGAGMLLIDLIKSKT